MRRATWISALAIAGAGAATVLLWPGAHTRAEESARETAVVRRQSLEETVLATGVVRPMVGAEVEVGSRISGTVVNLPVEVGDRVAVGQLLAELDATALAAAADEIRAEVSLARPRIALAEALLARRRTLAGEGLVSAEDLDIAQRDLEVERARLDSALARSRAAEIELGYTRITAPIAGVVAAVTTREGETVAAAFAAPTFVTVVDLDRLEVLAYVDETDIGRIHVDQAATFTVDTYADLELAAKVVAIQPRAELQERVVNYVARLSLSPPPAGIELRPEMTAHVRLLVERRDDALTVPRRAIRRTAGRPSVVVERDGAWREQPVRTGWRSDEVVEVLEGLTEGERVALDG